jgi:D-alanyl-D-alanine carboxypeptidase
LLAALALLLTLAITFIPVSYAPVQAESTATATAQPEATASPAPAAGTYDETTLQNLTEEDIRGEAAILIDADTGSVLFEKNANEKLYPASTTKIMTALLALEYGHLDDTVTVPKSITKLPKDSSLVPLKPGEKLTMRDLLYGLMLPSGNDAAVTIATKVAGSVDKFVKMMNEKAQALGCTETQFKNPHGYQNKAHYTTASDLALIAQEAMKNETFREIVSAKSYTIPKTNKSKKRKLTTTDLMLSDSSPNYYPYEIGVKTGHHSMSGQCFVGAAVKDGVTLISVVLKSSKSGMWTDTRKLMDYGFAQYAASPTPAPASGG